MIVTVGDLRLDLTDDQVADLRHQLGVERPDDAELVDAAEIARRFGVSREYVYDHAGELNAIRLGAGPKARLRFDPVVVAKGLHPGQPAAPAPVAPRRRRASRGDLLPIRGAKP